jgi:hypothetical protein
MPPVPEQQEGVATLWWREPTPYRIDLLFVLDDSPAMQPFAAALAQEMRIVGYELGSTGVDLDLHIGVITSDVGDEQNPPSEPIPGQCAGWGDGAMLRRSSLVEGSYIHYRSVRGSVEANVTGTVVDALGAIANVGTGGCAHPRPLEAMRVALDHDPRDGGFLRDNTPLTVALVGARDDESPRTVAEYEAFLKHLDRDVAVVVAGGTPLHAPSCGESATDRLYALSQLFPNRGAFASICGLAAGSLAELALIYHVPGLEQPIVSRCFDEPLADVDPATPGVQPACTVTEHIGRGTPDEHERLMAACGTGALPCWRVAEDSFCPLAQHLHIEVDRGGEDPPDNDVVEAQCVSS